MKSILKEIKLSKTTNYIVINRKYHKAIEWLYNARKFVKMCTFEVDGVNFYATLIMKGDYLEPHFGSFYENKFEALKLALETNNQDELKNLINDEELINKDTIVDKNINFLKVLSIVFSFMNEYLDRKPIAAIKILAEKRRFKIYKNLVQSNLKSIPYKIIREQDDFYTTKDGSKIPAKAIILKHKWS